MTDSTVIPEATEYLYSGGQLFTHTCTLPEPHDGNHVCACGYQWPLKSLGFATWHRDHPTG
jgi:hypothetical protein